MATGEPVEVEAYYPHPHGSFDVRAVPSADGLSLFFTEVTSRHVDRERAVAATGRLELLARASKALAGAGLDTEGAVAQLARLVVPQLADWALVSLLDGQSLRDVGSWHADPALRETVATYVQHWLEGRTDLGAVDRARETGRTTVVESGLTAARAGMTLDNARLYAEQRTLADRLQQAMLTPPPEPDHLHVVVRHQPAVSEAQVGGTGTTRSCSRTEP